MAKSQPTPLKREIRVFISSTFADMQQERNYLVKKIFPDIERECKRRNVEFIALDLRWGITEEESKRGKVVEICINEIDRTRPFFIGLIGGRYGWIPDKGDDFDPERISKNMPWIRPYLDSNISITEMEMRYGVLDSKASTHAHFFIRNDKDTPKKFRESNPANLDKLKKLKTAIRKAADEGLCTVSNYGTVKSLGNSVKKQLMDMIDQLYPIAESPSVYDLYDARQKHMLFELRRFYHPRVPSLIKEIQNHRRLLLSADLPGVGISAIAANEIPDCVEFIDSKGQPYHPRVIRSFVNTDVSSMELLKRMFINSLHHLYPDVDVSEINAQIDEKIDFERIIARFPKEEYLWIVDAPENFHNEDDQNISELAKGMQTIKHLVIVSSDEKISSICVNNQFGKMRIGLPNEKDLRLITTNYLKYYGKALSERQISAITASKILSNVKMLVTFLDILRNFGVYEDVDKFIHNFVSLDTPIDFYNKYLDYLEEEFSAEIVGEFFRRLQVSDMGMSWDGLFKGLLKTQIEKSSFMSVADNLLAMRFHNCILPKKSVVREVVEVRYPMNETDFNKKADLIIADYKKRMNEIVRDKRQSTLGRILGLAARMLMRGTILLEDDSSMTEWGILRAYIFILSVRTGNTKKAFKMLKHFGMFSVIQYIPHEIGTFIEGLQREKGKYYSIFNSLDIIIGRYLCDNHSLVLILDRFNETDEEKAKFRKMIARKMLPPKMKKELLKELDSSVSNTLFIDLWDENFDFENKELGGSVFLSLIEQAPLIISYKSEDYVRNILDKAIRTYSKISLAEPLRAIFLRIALYCYIRLNDSEGYYEMVGKIQESPNPGNYQQDLTFADIIFNLKNSDSSIEADYGLIEKAKHYADFLLSISSDNKRFNLLLAKILWLYYSEWRIAEIYPKEELIELLENSGAVIDTFYYNDRKEIAEYLLPAFLETHLSVTDRAYFHRMYAQSLFEIGKHSKAVEEYQKVLKLAEENNIINGDASVESLLCELLNLLMKMDDTERFERYATRFIEYAENGKFDCIKENAYNRVSNGYNYLLDSFAKSIGMTKAKENVLKYSWLAYQENQDHIILWSNYVTNLRNHGGNLSKRKEEIKQLIKQGQKLLSSISGSETYFIENLGKLFIIAEMNEEFDDLLRKYPNICFRNTLFENYARLLKITSNSEKREEYLKILIQKLQIYVTNHIPSGKHIPVDFIMKVVHESGEEREITKRLLAEAEVGEPSISKHMLAANIYRSLGDKEKGEQLERKIAFYLLEGRGRLDTEKYKFYALFQPESIGIDYASTEKFLLDRFVSTDKGKQNQYKLKIEALYELDKAKEFVEKAFLNQSECMKILEEEANLFFKYSQDCAAAAFGQFCYAINEEKRKGAAISFKLLQCVSEAAEAVIDTSLKKNIVFNLNTWQIFDYLLSDGKNSIKLGKNMISNGIIVADPKRQYELYREYYSKPENYDDISVASHYLHNLYISKNDEMYEKILADQKSHVTQKDASWPLLQVELAINSRRKGYYTDAMTHFEILNEYCQKNDKVFTEYLYILFPVITPLLVGNYEAYHKYSDWVRNNGGEPLSLDLLNCIYLLKVDNFTSAERFYASVRPYWNSKYIDTGESIVSEDFPDIFSNAEEETEENIDLETQQYLEEIVGLTAYRFIELARLYLRHGESKEKILDAYSTAERLLQKIPDSYHFFHHELSLLNAEIKTN